MSIKSEKWKIGTYVFCLCELKVLTVCVKKFSIHDHFIHFDGSYGEKGRNETTGGHGVDLVIHEPQSLLVYRKKVKTVRLRKERVVKLVKDMGRGGYICVTV